MEIYFVKETKPDIFMIAKFDDSSVPTAIYTVRKSSKNYYSCNCFGYYRQNDKTQHKHCLMVKHWINSLDKKPGFEYFMDGKDVSFRKMSGIEDFE